MLVFLKLGGSLITEKSGVHKPRIRVMRRLFRELGSILNDQPELRILLGHGSGSFGHIPAKKYGTIKGVRTSEEWQGFVEVWQEAQALNRIVMDEIKNAGLHAISFPPSATILSENSEIVRWEISQIQTALQQSILPVVFGDVIFDRKIGGTILSTENLFSYLALFLKPHRILLAGEEKGVWSNYEKKDFLVQTITPETSRKMPSQPQGSYKTDVTGGMKQKVEMMISLVNEHPEITVSIFSGLIPGELKRALSGDFPGTTIRQRE
jgi:isopentenyl phosphate kinase